MKNETNDDETRTAISLLSLIDVNKLLGNEKVMKYAKTRIDVAVKDKIDRIIDDREIKKTIDKQLSELLKDPDIKQQIKEKVKDGLEDVMLKLPEKITEKITNNIWNLLTESLTRTEY